MTRAQNFLLLVDSAPRNHISLWSAACQSQGWDRTDRKFRVEQISKIIGREIESCSEITSNKEIDRLFAALRALTDNLAAAQELDAPEMGDARRLVFRIRKVESQLLPRPGFDGESWKVRKFVQSLCADIAARGISPSVQTVDVEDLSAAPILFRKDGRERRLPSQLHQLLVTLTARLQSFKRHDVGDEVTSLKLKTRQSLLTSAPTMETADCPF